jgi:methionyl-tRNA formyltransferase
MTARRAVAFAYHNVGVRCLEALLANGVDVPLVITHQDNPREEIWFDSVAAMATKRGIATITPGDPNVAEVVARIASLHPDFLFSFYYRLMLKPPLLAVPARGALNIHGSLLPKYRGRVPVNWAIIHGETETGATLHYMTEKPDAGDIVAQTSVPILADDTAKEVLDKVTAAAERTLRDALPALLAGTAPRIPQDASMSSYFGARKPEDGAIDWSQSAVTIHNLVRAVAPPYPGASTTIAGKPARLLRTRLLDAGARVRGAPSLRADGDRIVAACGGGGTLAVLELEVEGVPIGPRAFAELARSQPVTPGP